jgi:hypothetical protein
LESLLARGLVVDDRAGGYALWPALREMVAAELSAETREQAHLRAAWLRSAHAEYTAAAYHYWQAGRLAEAIQVWFPHRQEAIARGQAGAALAIFQNISLHQVGAAEREALALLRAELKQLQGDLAGGSADLAGQPWSTPGEISAQARLQRARLPGRGSDHLRRRYGPDRPAAQPDGEISRPAQPGTHPSTAT